MIQINKPNIAPIIPYNPPNGQCKLSNAKERIKTKYSEYIENSGTPDQFTFSASQPIYGHEIIKQRLKVEIQHNKCCYCEKRIHDGYEVEHYRPSDGFTQTKNMGEAVNKPGYYWLTYDWNNLFYSCGSCNRNKGNYFPLYNPEARSICHLDDENCSGEDKMLIDLVDENPRDFIEFILVEPRPKANNYDRGDVMIKAVYLDRSDLTDDRAELWRFIIAFKESVERRVGRQGVASCQEDIGEYNAFLLEKLQPSSPYSAMVNDNLAHFTLTI